MQSSAGARGARTALLTHAVCRRDDLPTTAVVDLTDYLPFLRLRGLVDYRRLRGEADDPPVPVLPRAEERGVGSLEQRDGVVVGAELRDTCRESKRVRVEPAKDVLGVADVASGRITPSSSLFTRQGMSADRTTARTRLAVSATGRPRRRLSPRTTRARLRS